MWPTIWINSCVVVSRHNLVYNDFHCFRAALLPSSTHFVAAVLFLVGMGEGGVGWGMPSSFNDASSHVVAYGFHTFCTAVCRT